jgi:hypothetical protein
MIKRTVRVLLALLVITALLLSAVPRAAANGVTFTVMIKSGFLRSGPSLNSPRAYSVFQGQTFGVLGRNADASWLRLDFPGAATEAWVLAEFGNVSGDVSAVPVTAPVVVEAATSAPIVPAVTGAIPSVTFTVSARSVFARSAPSFDGRRVASLFRGQTYTVSARSEDGLWLRLNYVGPGSDVWVLAAYGTTAGDVGGLPLGSAAPEPTLAAITISSGPTGPAIPTVSAHARDIYQQGLARGNNPRAFSKIGDCQSVLPFFLAAFDNPADYRLGPGYAYLKDTIDNFSGSFSRRSAAVSNGFNVTSVLNPLWSDPRTCAKGETPLECEFRLHRPSIVIISMETWWARLPASAYEDNLRQIVEFSIARGAVPILATKADNLEGDGSINAAIVHVAQQYDIPLWNYWLAVQPLPDHGLLSDQFHLTWGRAFFDDPSLMQKGWTIRNLTALQSLDAVWKNVR